jgi:hypothetical protein
LLKKKRKGNKLTKVNILASLSIFTIPLLLFIGYRLIILNQVKGYRSKETNIKISKSSKENRGSILPRQYILNVKKAITSYKTNFQFYYKDTLYTFSVYFPILILLIIFISSYKLFRTRKISNAFLLFLCWSAVIITLRILLFSGFSRRYSYLIVVPFEIFIFWAIASGIKLFIVTNIVSFKPIVKFLLMLNLLLLINFQFKNHLSRIKACPTSENCNSKFLLKEVGEYLSNYSNSHILFEKTDLETIKYFSGINNYNLLLNKVDYNHFITYKLDIRKRGLVVESFPQLLNYVKKNNTKFLYYDNIYLDQNSPFIQASVKLYPNIFRIKKTFENEHYKSVLIEVNKDAMTDIKNIRSSDFFYMDATDKRYYDVYKMQQSSGEVNRLYQYTNSDRYQFIEYTIPKNKFGNLSEIWLNFYSNRDNTNSPILVLVNNQPYCEITLDKNKLIQKIICTKNYSTNFKSFTFKVSAFNEAINLIDFYIFGSSN